MECTSESVTRSSSFSSAVAYPHVGSPVKPKSSPCRAGLPLTSYQMTAVDVLEGVVFRFGGLVESWRERRSK